MNLPPRDFTEQELLIAQCLGDFGLRYDEQVYYHPYTVDFYIPEIKMVVEADGVYGHFKQRDVKRDMELMAYPIINNILL